MEWSIQEIARAAGTTGRTLRHYGELGTASLIRDALAVYAERNLS